jgi:hypothetical protein
MKRLQVVRTNKTHCHLVFSHRTNSSSKKDWLVNWVNLTLTNSDRIGKGLEMLYLGQYSPMIQTRLARQAKEICVLLPQNNLIQWMSQPIKIKGVSRPPVKFQEPLRHLRKTWHLLQRCLDFSIWKTGPTNQEGMWVLLKRSRRSLRLACSPRLISNFSSLAKRTSSKESLLTQISLC